MLQKTQIELILKVNGINHTSTEEEIRSVLLSASFKSSDIDTAIMILRENTTTHVSRIEGLHKVFRTNQRLNADEVSALLGIDVSIDELPKEKFPKRQNTSPWIHNTSVVLIAIGLASVGVIFAMYIYDVGLFYKNPVTLK